MAAPLRDTAKDERRSLKERAYHVPDTRLCLGPGALTYLCLPLSPPPRPFPPLCMCQVHSEPFLPFVPQTPEETNSNSIQIGTDSPTGKGIGETFP